jgi:hypothetical protein
VGDAMTSNGGLARALERADAMVRRGEQAAAETRHVLVRSLLDHQIPAGRKAGLFALDPEDWERGPRLWTGESIRTKLAAEHVFSQEAARLLHRLGERDPAVERAVALAAGRLAGTCYAAQHCTIGECATSFIGYVRYLASVRGDDARGDVSRRVQTLSQHRAPNGRWIRFPFFYTLLVLSELPKSVAEDEMTFARDGVVRSTIRSSIESPYAGRRTRLLQDILAAGGGPGGSPPHRKRDTR